MQRTYDATPAPKWVVATGRLRGRRRHICWKLRNRRRGLRLTPVDLHISGCPPRPVQLLKGLLLLLEPGRDKDATGD